MAFSLEYPGESPGGRQIKHDIKRNRDINFGPWGHSWRASRLQLAGDPDGLLSLGSCLHDRSAILVYQAQLEGDLLVRLLPWHVKEHRDRARHRTRSAKRPSAAGNEKLAIGDLRVIGQDHRYLHGATLAGLSPPVTRHNGGLDPQDEQVEPEPPTGIVTSPASSAG